MLHTGRSRLDFTPDSSHPKSVSSVIYVCKRCLSESHCHVVVFFFYRDIIFLSGTCCVIGIQWTTDKLMSLGKLK